MKLKGVLYAVLSAVIFGTSPIFFKTIAATGINTTTQVVVRSVITMALAAADPLMQRWRTTLTSDPDLQRSHRPPAFIIL